MTTGAYESGSPMFTAFVNDIHVPVQYYGEGPKGYTVEYRGAKFTAQVVEGHLQHLKGYFREKKPEDMSKWIKSPMAGAVINLRVKPGDLVTTGQPVAVVEAMKMQVHDIAL